MNSPEQEEGLSEWEAEDEIPLSQLQERIRNKERPEIDMENNNEVLDSELPKREESKEGKEYEIPLPKPKNGQRMKKD